MSFSSFNLGFIFTKVKLVYSLSIIFVKGLFRVRFNRGFDLPISEGYYYAFPGQEVDELSIILWYTK